MTPPRRSARYPAFGACRRLSPLEPEPKRERLEELAMEAQTAREEAASDPEISNIVAEMSGEDLRPSDAGNL